MGKLLENAQTGMMPTTDPTQAAYYDEHWKLFVSKTHFLNLDAGFKGTLSSWGDERLKNHIWFFEQSSGQGGTNHTSHPSRQAEFVLSGTLIPSSGMVET